MSLGLIAQLALVCTGFVALLTAALIDIRHFIIPNWLNLSLLILGLAYGATQPDFHWFSSIMALLLFFFIGALLFQFRFLGGGDVKLLAVVAFWAGISGAVAFLFYTVLAGGFVSVIYMSRAWLRKKRALKADPATDFSILRQPVPYGVAIALGGVYVFLSILEHLGITVRV